MQKVVIFWFQKDLRIHDNPGLYEACEFASQTKSVFCPLYILDEALIHKDKYNIGTNRRKLLAKILENLVKDLPSLKILAGDPVDIFQKMSAEYELHLFCNNDIEPYALKRHKRIHSFLGGHRFKRFHDALSVNIDVKTQTGNIYSVFTPFKKAVWQDFLEAKVSLNPNFKDVKYFHDFSNFDLVEPDYKSIYQKIKSPNMLKFGDNQELDLDTIFSTSPDISWVQTSEKEVFKFFRNYLTNLDKYSENRNNLDLDGEQSTSKMSPALAFGLISARQLKNFVIKSNSSIELDRGRTTFLTELIWREFYKYILYHFPLVLDQEFIEKRRSLTWLRNKEGLDRFVAWIRGETGYDIVDAGMKQLQKEGWMHNRTRMITASILTKNLGIDWRWGQAYFQMMLVDLDEASNNGGWQWSASVGVDPKPVRIFNPYIQAQKFDPNMSYRFKYLGEDCYIKDGEKLIYKIKPLIEHAEAREIAKQKYI